MKKDEKELKEEERPILRLNGKKYIFSTCSIFILILFGPLLSFLIYLFLSLNINYWIYELTTRHVVFFLNTIFNLNSKAIIFTNHKVFPQVFIPDHPFNDIFSITPDCIAAHVFGILIGLTICVPPSKDPLSRKNFNRRKAITLGIIVIVIYFLNVFRLVLLLYFTYIGIPFEFIHQSLFFLTAIVGAIIFIIILHKLLPEIFISLYYIYPLIKRNIINIKTDY